MGALDRYIEKKFGVPTHAIINPLVNACATTVTKLVSNNPDRLGLIIVNLGATAQYISFDNLPAADHGIYISPSGGIFSMIADEDAQLTGYDIYGIAITSANDLYIVSVEAL